MKKKKMYCPFVNFEKTFDKVWRVALWYKLLLNRINEKMYNFIVNMYYSIISCISYSDSKSDIFSSEVGVRDRPFNLKWGYGFLFRSESFFRTTRELEYLFCCRAKPELFFQNSTLGYMTNTLNQIIFFPPPKSEYFFQQHWESEYLFRKKTITSPPSPFKLNGRSLRQSDNLSPFLFVVFLNDLEQFTEDKNITGLESISSELKAQLEIYLKMFALLYADETVLMSENSLLKYEYSKLWKLKVNIEKTKIMLFSTEHYRNSAEIF